MYSYFYRQLRLQFDFHEDIMARESGCADSLADVLAGDENNFGVGGR